MEKNGLVLSLIVIMLLINIVYAEKLDIQVKNSYFPGEDLRLKIILYDDNNNLIEGSIDYMIENYYSDIMKEGNVNSNQIVDYIIPEDAIQGPWRVSAKYKEIETNRLFNVGKLEKADIKLEGDQLVIKNIGNAIYEKPVLIYIGDEDQTANIKLEVGETKKIKLSAPSGVYSVRVNDGTSENDLIFNQVSLTGNVIGLESSSSGSLLKRYPIVLLFLLQFLYYL
jgi:hypothetical protein